MAFRAIVKIEKKIPMLIYAFKRRTKINSFQNFLIENITFNKVHYQLFAYISQLSLEDEELSNLE